MTLLEPTVDPRTAPPFGEPITAPSHHSESGSGEAAAASAAALAGPDHGLVQRLRAPAGRSWAVRTSSSSGAA
jgi:hypothetical protein